MGPTNELKLDKKDKKILYELDLNSRISYVDLAKKLKTSKQVIKYRIDRLEKSGLIKRYTCYINYRRLGYTLFRIQIKLKKITKEQKEELIFFLTKLDPVIDVHMVGGHWNLVVGFVAKEMTEFYSAWQKIMLKYHKQIKEHQIGFYIDYHSYTKSYLINREDKSKVRILAGGKSSSDEFDLKILKSIQINARKTILNISKEVNLAPKSVRNRLKRLEKEKVIIGYALLLNYAMLGLHFYKVEMNSSDYSKLDLIKDFCHKHRNIIYCNTIYGVNMIEFGAHISSVMELQGIIAEMIEKTKVVESYEYYPILSPITLN